MSGRGSRVGKDGRVSRVAMLLGVSAVLPGVTGEDLTVKI